MNLSVPLALSRRVGIILLLWLLAGGIGAVFSTVYVEYDGPHTNLYARLWRVIFSPLFLPVLTSWTVVPEDLDVPAINLTMAIFSLCSFLGYTGFTVMRKEVKPFARHSSILAGLLFVSALCEICYWHWDSLHNHG